VGRTILDVAKEIGVPVHYECDGNCTCGTCYVAIEEGRELLSPLGAAERDHLKNHALESNWRLACQSRILGDVVVRVPPSKVEG